MKKNAKYLLKTVLFFVFLILSYFYTIAQDLPIDPLTKKVKYISVGESDSTSKEELFNRAKIWIAKEFTDSKEVLRMSDKESGTIIGKGNFKIYYKLLGKLNDGGNIYFTFTLFFKDNRFKIEVEDIFQMQQSTNIGTIEDLIECKKYPFGRKHCDYYIKQTDEGIKLFIENISHAIKTSLEQEW